MNSLEQTGMKQLYQQLCTQQRTVMHVHEWSSRNPNAMEADEEEC